jgi:hypothetical protein
MSGRWGCRMVKTLESRSFDDILGAAEGRYFGRGYRHVRHRVDPVQGDRTDAFGFLGVAQYPDEWSLDHLGNRRVPHLSTLDAILLPLLALESLMLENHDQLILTAARVRAGSSPWSDLSAVPIDIAFDATSPRFAPIRTRVGHFTVELELSLRAAAVREEKPSRFLETTQSLYGGEYADNIVDTEVAAFDADTTTLNASHRFAIPSRPGRSPRCFEGRRWGHPLLVDHVVTMSQLSQAVIQEASGRSRADYDNIWMRQMRISSDAEGLDVPNFKTTSRLKRDRVVVIDGARVHDLEVEVRADNGVHAIARLAYREQSPE